MPKPTFPDPTFPGPIYPIDPIDPIYPIDPLAPPDYEVCVKYQIYTADRGCITSCADPKFKKCADAFIAIYDPKFCALKKDGTWVSVTFECQACPKDNIDS